MPKCLISGGSVEEFISFGKMPIANGFLTRAEADKLGQSEFVFELKVGFCPESKMVQLTELVDERKMFHENYAFFSSTSTRMAEHFKRFAETVMDRYIAPNNSPTDSKGPFVVEIGSNDGIMLQNFARKEIRHLGIEPSKNVAEVARSKGINTISEFFGVEVARKIVAEYGQADAFMAANVMCHIPYQDSVMEGVRTLLKPKGVLTFEDPYLGDIIQKASFDQVYDEHVFYFSAQSVSYLVARHGLELIDCEAQPTHGGSMRYTVAHKGAYPVHQRVRDQLVKEDALGLGKMETYREFTRRVEKIRDDLMAKLKEYKAQGKRVVGYAATSKSTTVTNYMGITPDLVEFISDTTPIKQGKLSPGAHIPVKPYDDFKKNYPDYALLFGWNHAEEIMAKETEFKAKGGKFILYVPNVHVV